MNNEYLVTMKSIYRGILYEQRDTVEFSLDSIRRNIDTFKKYPFLLWGYNVLCDDSEEVSYEYYMGLTHYSTYQYCHTQLLIDEHDGSIDILKELLPYLTDNMIHSYLYACPFTHHTTINRIELVKKFQRIKEIYRYDNN